MHPRTIANCLLIVLQLQITMGDTQGVEGVHPCNRTDAQCPQCKEGEFLQISFNDSSLQCIQCSSCKYGQGVKQKCTLFMDTQCEPCINGSSYSEKVSQTEACQPCTVCEESKVQIRECTRLSDTLCMDRNLSIMGRSDLEVVSSTNPGSPDFIPQEDSGKNIIPVYCSILAAIIIGLLFYVAYKCWTSCKQKQQLAKARANELGSAEAEKLHSDSGVFLDTHSLQESQQLKAGSKLDNRLYLNMTPQRRDEVEQLLQLPPAGGKGWRHLAAQLGYEQERTDVIGRGEDPAHTLLSDWSGQEGATVAALCAALNRIERADVIAALTRPAEANSVV
uniref:Neurotrophin receptor associated death domain n=1 Tax=Erpetoichthys calabaricus TaxID=27687 RepID=A0A8C4SQ12_ERPCA